MGGLREREGLASDEVRAIESLSLSLFQTGNGESASSVHTHVCILPVPATTAPSYVQRHEIVEDILHFHLNSDRRALKYTLSDLRDSKPVGAPCAAADMIANLDRQRLPRSIP